MLWTDIFDRGIPWTRLILRNGSMPNDLNLRASQRASIAGGNVGRDDLLRIFWICPRKRVNMHRFKREILPVSGYAARHFVRDMRRPLARAVLPV